MSGYGRGDRGSGGGDGRRDYGRDYSRDPRERSPRRRDNREEYRRRDDRGSRDDRRDDFRGRGGRGGRGGYRGGRDDRSSVGGGGGGGSSTSGAPLSASSIPSLPSRVSVPKDGKELPETQLKPKSSFARSSVLVNHFRVLSLPIVSVWEYDIKFVIPAESRRPSNKEDLSPELKRKVLDNCADQLGFGRFFVFDGVSVGWSTEELISFGSQGTKRANMPGHTDERPNQMDVTVRNVGKVDVGNLVNRFTQGSRNTDPQVSWLNTLFRDSPSRKYLTKPRGLQYYAREAGLVQPLASTGNVLEALRGFHQSVSSHFGLLSINVDTSCTAYYTPDMSMLDVMKAVSGSHNLDQANNVNWDEVGEFVKGMIIYVTHRGSVGTGKRAKVKSILPQSAANAQFQEIVDRVSGETKTTTVQEYFLRKYNINLRYPRLPLIETPIGLLPPEVCMTAPGQRYKAVLEGRETADFIKFATAPAFVRSKQVMESVARLGWHDQEKLAAHGLAVEPKMMEVPAAKVPVPNPTYANRQKAAINNGAWNLRGQSFFNPRGFKGWGTIYFPPPNRNAVSESEIEKFMRDMYDSLKQYGISVPNGPPASLRGNPHGSIKEAMENIVAKSRAQYNMKEVVIFCFIHDGASADLYKTIKTATEVEIGVPCQVLKVEKSIRGKGQAQYCANVAMKVNLKIGGFNSVVEEPLLKKAPTMMIGGDVNHPAPSQLRSADPPPSFIALSGSNDMFAARYSAIASSVPATVEMMTGEDTPEIFPAMVGELVTRFASRNGGTQPQRVVYWRDGVSESQEQMLLKTEVKAMKAQFEQMRLPKPVKLTVVLAVKRHHTRFFPANRNDGDKLGNVQPGTIVESGDGSAFVVGHGALQGTVRPTHYKILLDENEFTTDEFHRLVMHGCYSYGKATRGVHTHAAIYYADQVAERSRARLRVLGDRTVFKDVHQDLRANTMWWQ